MIVKVINTLCFISILFILTVIEASQVYWKELCDYPKHDCGVINQRTLGSNFETGYTYIGTEYEKVSILDTRFAGSSAARLITPYIKTNVTKRICLDMEYLIENDGLEKIMITKQSRYETRLIYEVGDEKKAKWRLTRMQLILRPGINRFFIEARIKPGVKGVALIRSLKYSSGKCNRNGETAKPPVLFRRHKLFGSYFDLNNY